QNLGLQQLMAISGQKNRLVDGTINGKITGDGLLSQLNLTGELRVPQIQLQGVNLGELSIQSTFVPQNNRLVLQANIDNGETFPATVNGWISMNDPSLSCDLTAKLDKAPLQLLELVLKPALDSIRGMTDAEIRLTGSLKEPQIQGSILLNDARFRIPYLKNSYKITGNVQVEPGYFLFPNSYLQDMDRGQAKISGQVKHRNFREWTYKFEMDSARNILVLNEPRLVEGDYYFGLGRINGNGWIAGDEKSTQIQVRAETVKGSRLNIPLDDLKEDRTYNFIRFKSKGEAISKIKETSIEQAVSLRGIEFNMELTLNPACAVTLLLDRRYGDQIKGTGNGNLNLSLTREGDLSLTGNYIFEQGKYTFNFVNLVNKNFDIKSGGRIDWNGDPYAGIMQIDAVYKQPTSVRGLIGANPVGQTDSRNMLDVETFLNLSGPILQPAVKFRINLPTITDNNPNDVLVQQINRINNNEQELNNQVLGLLVSGQFIPSENLNAANLGLSTGATAFNSVTEMLTTRLSNLLNNSLGGGINLGINYRGDLGTGILNSNNSNNALADSNRRDLNLALNTTLFNDRLVIDGNLGMGNSFQVNSRNMAAGINLEYLINKSGTIRAKAFNRPDDRILFNQSQNLNYRQGVGLSYNRNFNRWSELLRKNPRQ
ncbi:MAG: translocation/assembly module TamB domain-containing protein, partial [Bacteroidota bacterium]